MYHSMQEVQNAALRILREIPQEKFENAIKDLPVRWAKCVQSGGDFFEGDGLKIPDFMVEVSGSEDSTDQEDCLFELCDHHAQRCSILFCSFYNCLACFCACWHVGMIYWHVILKY